MKSRDGKHTPLSQRAEAIAEYLEKDHWANTTNDGNPCQEKIYEFNNANESDFTLEELKQVLKSAKNDKQPGPDELIMELLKWLNNENKLRLLDLINGWWRGKNPPEELFSARVVPIYKKGETDNAANYRPISLLSSCYKVYKMLIRVRMQEALEETKCKTQYGFRPKRSTAHAIYVIRRVQDYAELKGAKLSMALLDWEKAFDKVQHDKLYIALERLGFSKQYVDVIKNCYNKPSFYVKDDYGCSGSKTQNSGIRQGCPLSPYLFTLVMTCVDYDIQSKVTGHVKNNRIPGVDFDMVYYADDTILISTSNRGLNELLMLTETISLKYGLKLNKGKCVAIAMNNEGQIHFHDGVDLQKNYETTYLGNEINKDVNIKLEISNKMQEVRKTWFKLNAYWKATGANKKWQLIIYDAIITSKLLYGLETIHLTDALAKKLDAFQMRGLRKILNLEPTFINRINTNKKVLAEATQIAYSGQHSNRRIKSFSEYHKERTAKLLGHIIKCEDADPLRQITFQEGTAYRLDYGKKRVGKPRQNWIHQTKKHVYEDVLHFISYGEAREEDDRIYQPPGSVGFEMRMTKPPQLRQRFFFSELLTRLEV